MSEPIGSEKYSNLKLKELQNLCKEKGLQVIGRKDTLISRLVEHDAAQEGGSSNTPKKIPTSSSSPKKSKVAVTSGDSSSPCKTVISTSVEADETKVQIESFPAANLSQAHVSPTGQKSEEQRRLERAKRFGTESVEDKKIERAMRFGIVSKETETAKRKARAQRFGEQEEGEEEDLDEEAAKKLKRAQRFGLVTADTEEEKKRMRKLRFAA
ncbi:hypothetical protein FOL47_008513 [Perkinsus chesapeaki]|uniref:SAP domain-containing protein n=1 Tax=Perkinsus chesapeaki TaxID=330153 RepID=A0A7J6MTS2_PERCH|nr:hypothetical protein FOL47_008513 [Perkinsus chesapeaki]